MRQLPRTRNPQHYQLNKRPPHHPRICRFRLVPELRLPLPLKHLLPPDIQQPRIQILHLLHYPLDFALVRAFDVAAFSYHQVQTQLDAADGLARAQPALGCGGGGRKADAVVAGVGGAEGEAAF